MKISRWTLTLFLIVAAFAGGAAWALQSGLAGAQTDNQPGAVVFTSDRSGNYDIYILDPETGVTTQLTNAPGQDVDPMWSPDGEYVAFASDRDGDFELFVMKKDGTDVRQLTANNAEDRQPVWQPNGLFIMYSSDVNGNWDLFVISADGAAVRQLTNDTFDERGPGAAAADETPVVPVATPLPAATATAAQPDAVVTSFQINIRQSPGLGAAILVTIPQNSTLDIIGRLQDNSWLQVTYAYLIKAALV
ncbi:MAG TPA: hypothetical protein VHP83_18685 [Aggregatilineaceae bacterium]|nr:hypothetical protein [Aggregatilineaceae bacterium]